MAISGYSLGSPCQRQLDKAEFLETVQGKSNINKNSHLNKNW